MTTFEFTLSTEDTERLFYLKQKNKKNHLTGNECAKQILENYLYSNCQSVPVRNEEGEYDFKD